MNPELFDALMMCVRCLGLSWNVSAGKLEVPEYRIHRLLSPDQLDELNRVLTVAHEDPPSLRDDYSRYDAPKPRTLVVSPRELANLEADSTEPVPHELDGYTSKPAEDMAALDAALNVEQALWQKLNEWPEDTRPPATTDREVTESTLELCRSADELSAMVGRHLRAGLDYLESLEPKVNTPNGPIERDPGWDWVDARDILGGGTEPKPATGPVTLHKQDGLSSKVVRLIPCDDGAWELQQTVSGSMVRRETGLSWVDALSERAHFLENGYSAHEPR